MTLIKTIPIQTLDYERSDVDKGYTDKYLDVNLSTPAIAVGSIEEKIKRTFIGGKGYDLWLLWQAVNGGTA